jgi:endosialidase-like protein
MRHVSCWVLIGVSALALGCGRPLQAQVCGDTTCAPGQACCIDCDGRGTCGGPGLLCPGTACGTVDGGTLACGDASCGGDQVCCIDCNGHGTCGTPGTTCAGAGCLCGGAGQTCCAAAPACGSGLMCCEGVPYPSGGECAASCGLKSDRNLKDAFGEVDPQRVLSILSAVPVTTWEYRDDATRARHMGPMAQDFHAAFGLGNSNVRIDAVDANGVLLVAVQALRENIEDLRAENALLRARVQALERDLHRRH